MNSTKKNIKNWKKLRSTRMLLNLKTLYFHFRTNFESAKDDCAKRRDNLLRLKISPQNSDGSVLSDEEYNR